MEKHFGVSIELTNVGWSLNLSSLKKSLSDTIRCDTQNWVV